MSRLLLVTGGSDSGGIVVRDGQDVSSQPAAERLRTGATVRVLEERGHRVRYEMVHGKGPATGWVSSQAKGRPLLCELAPLVEKAQAKADFDGQAYSLCPQCQLPLGDRAYVARGRRVHGECLAEAMARALQEEEATRRRLEAEEKAARRAEHGIGWVPGGRAGREGVQAAGESRLCSLLFDEAARTVKLCPPSDTPSAVVAEYLATALAVRRREGREPFFSLDPCPASAEGAMQQKRFEPAWIAGTSVGEVLFQADYYLKELSMGEYSQPVLGMTSCLDLDASSAGRPWSAREWFLVRKAEVQLSREGRLIPRVSMGVEAREQVRGEEGLEDAALTRPDHPLVQYAAEFTRNFDLIAERRSVVFHLRELAKAAVLAKFLGEAEAAVDDAWFETHMELRGESLQIPQLWNRRCQASVPELRDSGRVVMHGVYGGVDFGLSRFNLSALAPAPGRPAGRLPERRPVGLYRSLHAWGGEARLPLAEPRPQAKVPRQELRGVDLALGDFPLDAAVPAPEASEGTWRALGPGQSEAFWRALGGADQHDISERDLHFLRRVLSPHMSDRRDEGERFVPPDPSFDYVQKLLALTKREEVLGEQRAELFSSADFAMPSPGPAFPASWAAVIGSAQCEGLEKLPLPEGPEGPALEDLLRGAVEVFDRAAEDGARFRVYRAGALQLRTLQPPGLEARLCALLARSAPRPRSERCGVEDGERLVRVTELVDWRSDERGLWRHAVVFETERGALVLTERCEEALWDECPARCRRALETGKVLRVEGLVRGPTVDEVRARYEAEGEAEARRYALRAYAWAAGEPRPRAGRSPGLLRGAQRRRASGANVFGRLFAD